MNWPRLWPRSLVGRVFALYSTALAVFVLGGLALFYRFQFGSELEEAQQRAEALVVVVAPAVADAAVIGDYDTIQRTLEHAIYKSDFASAAFIDVKGGVVKALRGEPPDVQPPAWLKNLIAGRLYDTNQPVVVGGHDYGVLRLAFAPERIAGALWRQARAAFDFAALALSGGLLLIYLPLRRWLGNLGRIRSFEEGMRSGVEQPGSALADDAPIEFKLTFDVLSRAAANLQVQREQAAVTLGAIADGVLTLDPAGRVVLANPAACDALAMAASAVPGRPAHELLPELFVGADTYAPWRGRRVSIVTRDGRRRVLDTTLSSIVGADGLLYGHVLVCRDISEQHALDQRLKEELRSRQAAQEALRGLLEGLVPHAAGYGDAGSGDIEAISHMISALVQRLHEHSEQLSAIFALSPDGFVSFDTSRSVSYVSPAFTRLTGLDVSEVRGLAEPQFAGLLRTRCARGALPDFDTLRQATLDGGKAHLHLVELERPARRTLQITLRPGDGATISQVLHLRDVTYETEVDQLKSEFLSTAAHELRTPMTSIYGFVELMMHRRLSAERQKEVIETVHRQTSLMISIVNELLDLARIESRRGKDFRIEPVDLRLLAAEAVHDFKPPNERASPAVTLPDETVIVSVDRSKLAQALGNVLSNAYKYSPDGGPVKLDMRFDDATAGRPTRAALRVRDRGMGMTPAQLARVGERFYRADTSGNIPGTGLGMAIVKEIVELLGGTLELASRPGEGTEVTLWLPLVEPAARETEPSAQASLAA